MKENNYWANCGDRELNFESLIISRRIRSLCGGVLSVGGTIEEMKNHSCHLQKCFNRKMWKFWNTKTST